MMIIITDNRGFRISDKMLICPPPKTLSTAFSEVAGIDIEEQLRILFQV